MSVKGKDRIINFEERRRIQFHIIDATGLLIKLPKQAPRVYNPYVCIEGSDSKEWNRTSTSPKKEHPTWHENLKARDLTLSAQVKFVVRHRAGLPMINTTHVVVGSTKIYSLEELLEMQGDDSRESSVELELHPEYKTNTRATLKVNVREIYTRERIEAVSARDAAAYKRRLSFQGDDISRDAIEQVLKLPGQSKNFSIALQ